MNNEGTWKQVIASWGPPLGCWINIMVVPYFFSLYFLQTRGLFLRAPGLFGSNPCGELGTQLHSAFFGTPLKYRVLAFCSH